MDLIPSLWELLTGVSAECVLSAVLKDWERWREAESAKKGMSCSPFAIVGGKDMHAFTQQHDNS